MHCQVINYQKFKYVYKYIDCKSTPSEFCFSCCEVEFGEKQQDLRNECYQQCVKEVKVESKEHEKEGEKEKQKEEEGCKEKRDK